MRGLLNVGVWVACTVVLGWLAGRLFRRAARTRYGWFIGRVYDSCRRPAFAVLLVAALFASLPGGPNWWLRLFRHLLLLVLVVVAAWLLIRALLVAEHIAFGRLPDDPTISRRLRRSRTQIRLIRRLTAVVVTLLAIAIALMSFRQLRAIGISLVTSAGVVGVVLGLAARTSLANAFAGVQIAFADALHVEDVVVVEGEWGRVEEVKLTNVVIRMWDERRLILPTSFFTENSFQNWTRHEARVVGEIELHVDYIADLEELRSEARRLVERSPLWDRSEWVLQVIEITPQTVEVQVRATAADAPSAWDLRCDLREGLLKYLREQHPQWLPRTRSEYKP